MPELAESLERILRENGHADAAASVQHLTVQGGVTSSVKAELSFRGPLRTPRDLLEVHGRHRRTNVRVYLDNNGEVIQLSLLPLGMLRPALRRLCERHEDFDWDRYYGR
jgi:hypothetical protein